MRLFLDTNIVIDILSLREGYDESLRVLRYCLQKHIECYISTVTVTNAVYILRKLITPGTERDVLYAFTLYVNVAAVNSFDIAAAFLSPMKDYEDAVQAICAKRINADYIVTRNIKDFRESPVTAILPGDLLNAVGRVSDI
jgi:predicted nucleic acid-binding protein